jgi:N-acetylmuramoyl-L-alanine amidase
MTTIDINDSLLKQAFGLNAFEIPVTTNLLFIGLRGCLPTDISNNAFNATQQLALREIDHKNLRCTILQWRISDGQVAAFAASTVPHLNYILGYKQNPPKKSNCLTPGFYKNYIKGKHRPSKSANWHDAFRQNGQPLAIRRTYNDTVYNNFDNIEVSKGCDDNIHAAWTLDEDSGKFASAGCQVIMGIPYCDATKSYQNNDRGPWATFRQNAYPPNLDQQIFPYALFNASELYKLTLPNAASIPKRLKFGSSGVGVVNLQNKLIQLNYLAGNADGDFGTNTFNAVKKYQQDTFGASEVDCIVGPVTAQALGIIIH